MNTLLFITVGLFLLICIALGIYAYKHKSKN